MRSRATSLLLLVLVVGFLGGITISVGAAPMMGTYVGYLMDVACGSTGHGADGSDTLNSPWDHTKGCLIVCKASGYGISIKDGDQYKHYKFDTAGNALAFKIANATSKNKDVQVSVDGTLDNGVITVKSIKEANVF